MAELCTDHKHSAIGKHLRDAHNQKSKDLREQNLQESYKNLTFSFYEFENDERIIETSFKIIITNFYSELFVKTSVITISLSE